MQAPHTSRHISPLSVGIGGVSGSSLRGSVLGGLDLGASLLALLLLLRAVEVQIRHDLPLLGAADLTTQAKDLAGKEPPHETDGVSGLGVARDGNVDVLHRGIRVAERNDGDVDVRGLSNGL